MEGETMRMSRRWKRMLQISWCLILIVGAFCQTSSGAEDPEQMLEEIQRQIIALRQEFKLRIDKATDDRLAIYENLQAKVEDLVSSQAPLVTSYADISQKAQNVLTSIEVYDDQLATLEQLLDSLETTLAEHLDQIETHMGVVKEQVRHDPSLPLVESPSPQPSLAEPTPTPESSPLLDFSPGQLFRASYGAYRDGDYEVAIAGFQKFLEIYPDNSLAGAAQYWIAESFVKLEEYAIAIQEYERLITAY
ncbi:tetratricopeptide repeat protein, partial [candidate division KSB3 bacterium]|nr:tetratricopeptide repeat protein [candidate division KSB3 bacterium]MBD3327278.1 tetratricopeptide repeat protein [candidate division KSB3 bacterium]